MRPVRSSSKAGSTWSNWLSFAVAEKMFKQSKIINYFAYSRLGNKSVLLLLLFSRSRRRTIEFISEDLWGERSHAVSERNWIQSILLKSYRCLRQLSSIKQIKTMCHYHCNLFWKKKSVQHYIIFFRQNLDKLLYSAKCCFGQKKKDLFPVTSPKCLGSVGRKTFFYNKVFLSVVWNLCIWILS